MAPVTNDPCTCSPSASDQFPPSRTSALPRSRVVSGRVCPASRHGEAPVLSRGPSGPGWQEAPGGPGSPVQRVVLPSAPVEEPRKRSPRPRLCPPEEFEKDRPAEEWRRRVLSALFYRSAEPIPPAGHPRISCAAGDCTISGRSSERRRERRVITMRRASSSSLPAMTTKRGERDWSFPGRRRRQRGQSRRLCSTHLEKATRSLCTEPNSRFLIVKGTH